MSSLRSSTASPPRCLSTADFLSLWETHKKWVTNFVRKTLRRLSVSKTLLRVVACVPEAALPSLGAVREALWSDFSLTEDVTQDVALAVWEYLTAGKPLEGTNDAVRRFLCTLTVRCTCRAARRTATSLLAAGNPAPEETPELGEAVSRAPSAELTFTLRDVLARLPVVEQQALLAAAWGESHEEVAARDGVSLEASRARRSRACKHAAALWAA